MKVNCDECQNEYELTSLNTNLKEELPNDVERYYIECPNCKAQYTAYYLNDELKRIQFEMARLLSKSSLKIKQKNKLHRLRQELERKHEQLKATVESTS